MGVDTILSGVVFDWTFLNPLIERDNGKKESKEQVLAQTEISPEIYY